MVRYGHVHTYDAGMPRWFPKMYQSVGESALLAVVAGFRVCVAAITYHLVIQHHCAGLVR